MDSIYYDPNGYLKAPIYLNQPGKTTPSNNSSISTASDMASSPSEARDLNYYLASLERKADEGDVGALEHLFNYYATKDSEKNALDWTAQREDTAYQRMMEDLKKAGISPYALGSSSPSVSSYSGRSYSGNALTSSENSKRTSETSEKNTWVTGALAIAKVIGTALMFALMAA